MLTILGRREDQFCDGLSRRSFLHVGGLAMGGVAMPALLAAQSHAASKAQQTRQKSSGLGHKAVIMIFLAGGPPHQDMWDIKENAPKEIRGEFNAINTNVPGIRIGELFPRLAKMTDKVAYIRSIVGARGGHDAWQCLTGHNRGTDIPCMGSALSYLEGQVDLGVPAALGLSPKTSHAPWGDNGSAGFLGAAYKPFTPEGGQIKDNMVLNGVTLDRLRDRQAMLKAFDRFRRQADASGEMEGMDAYQQQAVGILTSSKLAQALDLSKEPQSLRDRYGKGTTKPTADGPWKRLDQFLMARRLVEAGARCVTLAFSRWDWHGGNFKRARQDMPMLDQGVSALVQDLHDRGIGDDVSVVVWGEFGRTPKINKNAGRDHWPKVSCALLAGGGMNTGQVIGSTTRDGGEAKDRPVTFQEVFATLYHNCGVDVETATIPDLRGRPRYLVDEKYKKMRELV